MSVFWLSWYDDPEGKPGLPTDGIQVWISGYRGDEPVCCARVEAADESDAWRKADRYYPGARVAERRFSDECADDWWPPGDRFPPARLSGSKEEG